MLSTYHVFFALGGKIGREQPSTPCARGYLANILWWSKFRSNI